MTDYGKTLSEITITSEIDGKKVTSIRERAFYDCDNLVSVNINARYIKESAFENCDNLENITLCDNGDYKTIWQNAFADTAFFNNEQNWDNGLLYIGKVLYKAKEFVSGDITIKPDTESISDYAFVNCKNLTSVSIPASVQHLTGSAFLYCDNLQNILVDKNNAGYFRSINGNLYRFDAGNSFIHYCQGKPNETFTIASEIRCIGDGAFLGAKNLKKVIIPDGITYIGNESFRECEQLTEIIIPASITKIGRTAFLYSDNLNTINYVGSETQWNAITNTENIILNENVEINFNYGMN